MFILPGKIALVVLLFFQEIQQPVSIIFFGDSITAGYGIGPDLAFPALVEAALTEVGHEVKVVNAGLSGETSAGGLTRIEWILSQPVDIFVLELGANDGLRGLPLHQTKLNLQAIINKVKSKNPLAKIVISGMMVPPNMGPEYSIEFKSLFASLAETNNAVLIPFLLEGIAGDKELNQPDGIHPNARGHAKIAELLYPYLVKLVK